MVESVEGDTMPASASATEKIEGDEEEEEEELVNAVDDDEVAQIIAEMEDVDMSAVDDVDELLKSLENEECNDDDEDEDETDDEDAMAKLQSSAALGLVVFGFVNLSILQTVRRSQGLPSSIESMNPTELYTLVAPALLFALFTYLRHVLGLNHSDADDEDEDEELCMATMPAGTTECPKNAPKQAQPSAAPATPTSPSPEQQLTDMSWLLSPTSLSSAASPVSPSSARTGHPANSPRSFRTDRSSYNSNARPSTPPSPAVSVRSSAGASVASASQHAEQPPQSPAQTSPSKAAPVPAAPVAAGNAAASTKAPGPSSSSAPSNLTVNTSRPASASVTLDPPAALPTAKLPTSPSVAAASLRSPSVSSMSGLELDEAATTTSNKTWRQNRQQSTHSSISSTITSPGRLTRHLSCGSNLDFMGKDIDTPLQSALAELLQVRAFMTHLEKRAIVDALKAFVKEEEEFLREEQSEISSQCSTPTSLSRKSSQSSTLVPTTTPAPPGSTLKRMGPADKKLIEKKKKSLAKKQSAPVSSSASPANPETKKSPFSRTSNLGSSDSRLLANKNDEEDAGNDHNNEHEEEEEVDNDQSDFESGSNSESDGGQASSSKLKSMTSDEQTDASDSTGDGNKDGEDDDDGEEEHDGGDGDNEGEDDEDDELPAPPGTSDEPEEEIDFKDLPFSPLQLIDNAIEALSDPETLMKPILRGGPDLADGDINGWLRLAGGPGGYDDNESSLPDFDNEGEFFYSDKPSGGAPTKSIGNPMLPTVDSLSRQNSASSFLPGSPTSQTESKSDHGAGDMNSRVRRKSSLGSFSSSPSCTQLQVLLGQLSDWNFDSLTLAEETGGKPLYTMLWVIFSKCELIKEFRIDRRTFKAFSNQLESQYQPMPYHNSAHAADVLVSVHHLLYSLHLGRELSSLETMTALFAAAVHDVNHPGRNNNFLIRTDHRLSIIYSDHSVLEQMHLANAFQLLHTPGYNILSHLSKDEYLHFRKSAIRMVLATDLRNHFETVTKLKGLAGTLKGNFVTPDRRDLILEICIKVSDIGHASKRFPLHKRWSDLITEEFFQQGDEERALGINISDFMDRTKPDNERNQVSFLDFIALPLFKAFREIYPPATDIFRQVRRNRNEWKALHREVLQRRHAAMPNEDAGGEESDGESDNASTGSAQLASPETPPGTDKNTTPNSAVSSPATPS
ncbi:cAMP-specific 3',5'-cyclic phosphodiesterase [Hondaea fermentalgiana]|uniref:Phosphodiesterase n=1 Tax=Hondaea fermentalgiana TaxID=2315210 RepID=A0A2R5G298_9STRA|nr:cAMP-specific 3',5'-cyclic phosphodiesterase [Hondaea fermentalgiana]|eukprot:GBG25112.1 cAMP-specific 3',5'-cyclic phosphodiesterase [Hondaea fermentalgiana]